ncbi:Hydroxyacylglutathione hydrolase [Leucobacter aridicollis]|uniref:Glyoxylase-like metal-dependent hydrolase (Beta-lactamase superfamily II) n=1 Tax=Leucobacter aridicollis TaxID=283878 RepID=A0A852RD70_9MICO|nr:MBL fold metallo-hydrolase [Leucobacter aridicollis]MBL3682120.1 MBL fold metallo-hydrolase [Leucobacter aridicollis]MCS3428295.1 glyoxylase-like metal-dependent hydrolase (beta-lactamase superfamily II) [Leucobacter aridicollis]NYD26830.1 glyoxylase-like metal-dependent hydrolase (beta-lactamase superfamily II) [Leucobacter aridicollis]RKQ94421.1 glyoxylase-like metal-dependent hydrolase (beta-lactamase superfamily II) [Mycolicibacterium mucogenicum 261Sha1.1M5]
MAGDLRIERVVTFGVLGAGRPGYPPEGVPLDNNVWIVGDDDTALIIDAAHDADAVVTAVGDRDPLGILLTHGHEDHVNAAIALADALDTHLYLHPADLFLWEDTHGSDRLPDFELADGATFSVAGAELVTLHTPGHTPGSVSFYAGSLGTLLSGDTLFEGGPGATRWEYSSFPQLIESISDRLLTLPAVTTVLPGHGSATTIGAEAPQIAAWAAQTK